ncbi:MAG: hypothetical protein IPJ57_14730 [Gemmatimonadetes bacterium]|nr:hypothetical protein [Gemmatimonadota bacterium]
MRSLQRTLALRYGFTMLVALVAVALWAFLGVQRTLARQLDLALDDGADLMVDVVAKGEGLAQHAGARDLSVFLDELNRLVVLRDRSGRILDYNMPMASLLPLDSAAFRTALQGRHAWATDTFAGRRFRSVYVTGPARIGEDRAPAAVVQVASSLRPLQQATDSLLLRLVLTALIGTLLTTAGAGWLARSSLEPVGEIAAQARAVSVRGDGHRITVHADVLELQDLIAMLNGMLQRLDAALLQQRRIISDVGHDLRTPITAMRGELEVALRTPRSPVEYQALLRSVLEEVDHLAGMGDAMIALARLEAGEAILDRRDTDLVALVQHEARRFAARHPALALAPPETPAPATSVTVDARLLGLALGQLLENALRHVPPGTPVRTGVRDEDTGVALVVEDAGPGVPAEQLPRLFEPFFRQDLARTRGGAGLGLTLVRSVAQAHGGAVLADRSPLGGLRVRVVLPRTPAG